MKKPLILATFAALTLSAHAAIFVTNGKFEDPNDPAANSGDAAEDISGWFDTTAPWGSWHYSAQSGGDGKGNECLGLNAAGWVYQSIGTIDAGTIALDWSIEVKSTDATDVYQIELFAGSFGSAAENVDIKGHGSAPSQPLALEAQDFSGATAGFKTGSFDVSGQSADTEIWVRLNQSSGHWRLIDNLTIAAVPEPLSAALLGIGGLALMLRHRR